ncbi:MAG: 2-methylcitrate dehydratase 2 [Phycisphaerae bacterium]|nr:2-methylcitrate dehydratase 2 [Phycisphaerae bacterium]
MTLGRRIATWVQSIRYEDLPASTIHEVKRRVIDSLATCLGAYHSNPGVVARAQAMSVKASPRGGATVWGTTHRTTPDLAAFANGAMVRYLDYNDTYLSLEPAHPSDNLSAAVAVAQAGRRTGRDLILAAVIGYELQCRMCDADSLRKSGWDHVVYGAVSTAMLAGKLWGLSEDQLEHALGLAGVCNIATRQTRTGQISDWKACAFSNAARNGVFAADLARRGLTGPFEIFEGPKGWMKQLSVPGLRDLVLAPDGRFMIDRTYIKYWPAEYHSQSAIDACLQLRPHVQGRDIASILIKSFEAAVSIIGSEPEKLRPTSRETADHSLFYCCAAALVDGDVTLATFDEERLTDPRLLNLIDRTTIVEDAELNKGYPKGIPNDITITCADGTVAAKRVDFPRGHAENPMTDDEVVAKFRRLADGVIRDKEADRILKLCWKLDTLKDVTPVFAFKVMTSPGRGGAPAKRGTSAGRSSKTGKPAQRGGTGRSRTPKSASVRAKGKAVKTTAKAKTRRSR